MVYTLYRNSLWVFCILSRWILRCHRLLHLRIHPAVVGSGNSSRFSVVFRECGRCICSERSKGGGSRQRCVPLQICRAAPHAHNGAHKNGTHKTKKTKTFPCSHHVPTQRETHKLNASSCLIKSSNETSRLSGAQSLLNRILFRRPRSLQ